MGTIRESGIQYGEIYPLLKLIQSFNCNGQWKLARPVNRVTRNIVDHSPPDLLPDKIRRIHFSGCHMLVVPGTFTVKSAWNAMRHNYPNQSWNKVVWGGKGVHF